MKLKRLIARDLFVENKCFNFDYAEAAWMTESIPRIGAVSFLCTDHSAQRDESKMIGKCAEAVDRAIRQRSMEAYLFLVHAPIQPRTVMVQHKRLWKSFPITYGLDPLSLSKDAAVEYPEGIRFGGVARISSQDFSLAARIAHAEEHGALMIASRSSGYMELQSIKDLIGFAFPVINGKQSTRLNLLSMVIRICAKGDVAIRVAGNLESGEISLDMLMQPELLSDFEGAC